MADCEPFSEEWFLAEFDRLMDAAYLHGINSVVVFHQIDPKGANVDGRELGSETAVVAYRGGKMAAIGMMTFACDSLRESTLAAHGMESHKAQEEEGQ